MKKCVASQRKSSLYDGMRIFLCQKERSLKNGGKQQDEGDAGK